MELELRASITISDRESMAVMAPMHGAVLIPIVIKSVPVLDYLSTRSPCTVVTPEFAQNFAISKKNLESRKLRDFSGRKIKTGISAF